MRFVATRQLKDRCPLLLAGDLVGLKDPALPILRFSPITAAFAPSLTLTLADLVRDESTFGFSSLSAFPPPQINSTNYPGVLEQSVWVFADPVAGSPGFTLFHDGATPATVFGLALVGNAGTVLYGVLPFDPALQFELDNTNFNFVGDLFFLTSEVMA